MGRSLDINPGFPINNLTFSGEGDRVDIDLSDHEISAGEDRFLTFTSNQLESVLDRATSYTVTVNFYYTSEFKKVTIRNRILLLENKLIKEAAFPFSVLSCIHSMDQ